MPCLLQQDLPAARLACADCRAAIDGSRTRFHVSIKLPAVLHTPVSLQHSIQHFTADISSAQAYVQLQCWLQHLPELRSLVCTGRRTWPPQAPAGSPQPQPHPKLQTVKFDGFLTSLTELAALAPQLDTLICSTLALHVKGIGSSAALTHASSTNTNSSSRKKGTSTQAASSSSSSMSGAGVLSGCKQLAAEAVRITASDEVEAGQAFAAALPQLQVLSDTPAFTWSIPAGFSMRHRVLSLQHALACCSNIRALRTFGSSTALGGLLPQQLQGLQQLRCLSVFGVGPAVELLGIRKLTQLTALSLTFELPDKAQGKKLLTQLGQLPKLEQLALPAKLLCGQCCPGASEHLQAMLWPPATTTSSAAAGGGHDDSRGSRTGSFRQLRELWFLCREKADHRRYQCGDYCKHPDPDSEGMQGSLTALLEQFDCGSRSGQRCAASVAAGATAAAGVGADRVAVAPQVQQRHADSAADDADVCGQQLRLGVALLGCQPVRLQEWRGVPADWFR